jgi:hypothetical protein
MFISSRTLITPIWAIPLAPPPLSTSPIRGRDWLGTALFCPAERGEVVKIKEKKESRTKDKIRFDAFLLLELKVR